MSYANFSPVDKFAFTYGLDMDQDLAPTHFLGDISISFDSVFCSESTSVYYTNLDFPMDYQESAGLMPLDSMEETPQHGGILAPSVADYVLAPADKPFDGEICTQDTYLKDVKRFMDKHGKAPHFSAFIQESFTVRFVSIVLRFLGYDAYAFYVYFWHVDAVVLVPSRKTFLPIFQLLLFENKLLLFPNVQGRPLHVHQLLCRLLPTIHPNVPLGRRRTLLSKAL